MSGDRFDARPSPNILLYATFKPNHRPKETRTAAMSQSFMGAKLSLHNAPNAPIENSATHPRHQKERVDSHPRLCSLGSNAKVPLTKNGMLLVQKQDLLILACLVVSCVQFFFVMIDQLLRHTVRFSTLVLLHYDKTYFPF